MAEAIHDAGFQPLQTLVDVCMDAAMSTDYNTGGGAVTSPTPTPLTYRFDKQKSILIVGMRGAGKTTVGLILATYLSWTLIDSDKLFQRLYETSIKDFVAKNGWDAFRAKETIILEQLLRSRGRECVIVLSSSTIERDVNRTLISEWGRSGGLVIHVCRRMKDVLSYLTKREPRSSLSSWPHLEEDYKTVWERRMTFYEEISNITFVSLPRAPYSDTKSPLSLKHIESALVRLVRATLAIPSPLHSLDLSWSTRRTTALFLTGGEQALTDPDLLDIVIQGADAIEVRVDTLLSSRIPSFLSTFSRPGTPTTPPNSNGSLSVSPPNQFHHHPPPVQEPPDFMLVSYHIAFIRQHASQPIIYTVRTAPQGGTFTGTKQEHIRLIEQGFKLTCDLVDIELTLTDEEIMRLVALKGGDCRVIMSWVWTAPQDALIPWSSPEVFAIYNRAVRLGADIVKLYKPAHSVRSNFEITDLQGQLAKYSSVPLLAINTGAMGQMSRLLNPILTPLVHPRLSRPNKPGELSFTELQSGRYLLGMTVPRITYDFQSALEGRTLLSGFSKTLSDGYKCLNLSFDMMIPSSTDTLSRLAGRSSFGGALISHPISSTPPQLYPVSLSAKATGFADIIVSQDIDNTRLGGGEAIIELTSNTNRGLLLDNLRVVALNHSITKNLSPINAIGPWTTCLVVGAEGREGKEVFYALAGLEVGKVLAVDCSDECIVTYKLSRLSRTVHQMAAKQTQVQECTLEELEADASARNRPPVILIYCSTQQHQNGVYHPPAFLERSSTGGLIINLTMNPLSSVPDGWIEVPKSDIDLEFARLFFNRVTGKILPKQVTDAW